VLIEIKTAVGVDGLAFVAVKTWNLAVHIKFLPSEFYFGSHNLIVRSIEADTKKEALGPNATLVTGPS